MVGMEFLAEPIHSFLQKNQYLIEIFSQLDVDLFENMCILYTEGVVICLFNLDLKTSSPLRTILF